MNNPWGQQQPITQQGPMGGFRRGMRGAFGDKSNMMATSLGLMFGQNPQQQMQAAQNGLMNGGQIRAQNNETQKAEQQRNATMEYFKANRPDLAAQVQAGMPMSQAWSELKAQPVKRETIKGADGYQYYQDDQSRVLPNVGQEAPNQTTGIQEYEYAKQQGFEGDYIAFQNAKKGKGFSVTTADGTVVQMGGSNGPPEMKEAQAKANLFASRMEQSNQILESLENEGTDLGQKLMSGVPIVGNYGITSEHRQYDQAKRDFLNAVLRQESGAVIADTEFANGDKQYFPQPGDDPQTIAQKKENRRIAMQAIRQASAQPETNPTGMPSPNDMDFSQMSDEELEAIANGS